MRETMSIWLTCIYVCLVSLQPCLSMLGSRRGQNISGIVVVVGPVALLCGCSTTSACIPSQFKARGPNITP